MKIITMLQNNTYRFSDNFSGSKNGTIGSISVAWVAKTFLFFNSQ